MSHFALRRLGPICLRTGRRQFNTTPTRRADNPIPANDPNRSIDKQPSPVSSTNALPTSSEGSFDKVLQESVERGNEMRVAQAPNRQTIWSRSQQPREKAMVGPRFEQTIMEDQVRLDCWTVFKESY